MSATVTHTAVIPISSTTSNACDLGNVNPDSGLCGFVTPAALTGTAITFQVSTDDVTYGDLYNAGTQLSITVSTSRAYAFTQDQRASLRGWRFIKLVSGSTEAAARSILLLVK